MTTLRTIVLVACSGQKLEGQHPAGLLYQSSLFKKARAWALTHGDAWLILSAKHGVVEPDSLLDAYNVSLTTASKAYRQEWQARVAAQLAPYAGDRLIVLAGKRYCEGWTQHFAHSERPLAGLGIGQQLAWLTPKPR